MGGTSLHRMREMADETSELLTVTPSQVDPGTVMIAAVGEIDVFSAPVLHAHLERALAAPGVRRVVLDLLMVDFLGSAGLGILVTASRTAVRQGSALHIVVGDHGPARRPIEVMGLDRHLNLHQSVSDALGA